MQSIDDQIVPQMPPQPKGKFNLTLGKDTRKKLEHLAELEKRSASNLIEVMVDDRWDRLADTQGFPFIKVVSDIADQARINVGNEQELHRFKRAVLDQLLRTKTA